jgi:Cof subfamily protein (haloacid dehalogenase superfamily)
LSDRPIRLLALDIDGTLLTTGREVSPVVIEAVRRALARGCHAMLLTGRSRGSTLPIASQFPEGSVLGLGTFDGARLERYPHGEILRDVRLDPETAAEVLAIMCRYGLGPALFPSEADGDIVYTLLESPPPARWQGLNSERTRTLAAEDVPAILQAGVTTLSAFAPREVAYACDEELRHAVGERASVIVTLSELYGGYFAQVAGLGATKADALRFFTEHLAIPLAETLAIGDWLNDRAMIEMAGVGVAMAEAPEEVRAAADWVTAGVREDGVARAIERFVLV